MEVYGNSINERKFFCTLCRVDCKRLDAYNNHLQTNKHLENEKSNFDEFEYHCETCNYHTSRYNDITKHFKTKKHILRESWFNSSEPETDNTQNKQHLFEEQDNNSKNTSDSESCENETKFSCTLCSKAFQTNSGLWKHRIKCSGPKDSVGINSNVAIECQKHMIESQKQMFDYLEKKDQEFKSLVLELCKNVQTNNTMIQQINTNTNSNNTTNSNNSFNLQVFLNETCKDAVNLSEFIRSIKVSFEDIERVAQLGYVEGLSEVIIKNLNALGVERRPIHCTDAKRQVIYVKEDDKWEKEDEKMHHIQFLIDEIQKANLRQLAKWRDAHPSCLTSNSRYTDSYNHMSQELLGGDCKRVNMATKDSRIMSKIAKEMTIDKDALGLLK